MATDEHGATAAGPVWEFRTEQICVPKLLSPAEGALLDNGRTDGLNLIEWEFDWSDCSNVDTYHLYVIGGSATIPLIDNNTITDSDYQFTGTGYIASMNAEGWQWRVRASRDGQWGAWSQSRTFDVEPPNTDPPYNDDFDTPIVIDGVSYKGTQSTAGTTTAADDPHLTCAPGQRFHTVWYRFTAPEDGILSANTFESTYDTVLAAWTGSRGALTLQVCYDDSNGGLQSSFNLVVTAGTTYFIEVASYDDSIGNLSLNVVFNADTAQ